MVAVTSSDELFVMAKVPVTEPSFVDVKDAVCSFVSLSNEIVSSTVNVSVALALYVKLSAKVVVALRVRAKSDMEAVVLRISVRVRLCVAVGDSVLTAETSWKEKKYRKTKQKKSTEDILLKTIPVYVSGKKN